MSNLLRHHTFWFSLLGHILLFLSFSLFFVYHPKQIKTPSLDIPAYTYTENTTALTSKSSALKKNIATEKKGVAMKTSSASAVQPAQSATKSSQPVHLIGDKQVAKPLIKLLGQALAANLIYPKIAVDFNLKGIVYIGFTLQPDGYVRDAQIVKRSNAAVLDQAALAAVNAMSPVKNVSRYLPAEKFLVVGIIFN